MDTTTRPQLSVPALSDDLREQLTDNVSNGWQDSAACGSVIDDAWFPELCQPSLRSAAVRRCGRCPVRRSCLAFALAEGEEYGVWGGTTEVQRDALRIDLADGVAVVDVLDSATVRPAYLFRRTA